jgi:hypothetical protein
MDSVAKLLWGDFGKVGFLWEELPQEPIGVLVQATFPRSIGVGKKAGNIKPLAEFLMLAELLAVVEGEAKGGAGQFLKERNGCLVDASASAVGTKSGQEELGRLVHAGEYRSPMAFTHNGVSFKMTNLPFLFRLHWTCFNTYAMGNLSTT